MSQDIKLALVRFLYNEFGYQPSEEEGAFEQVAESMHNIGRQNSAPNQTQWNRAAFHTFTSPTESNLTEQELEELDANINEYLESINDERESQLQLRYYQYLAVFFTEYLLKKHKEEGVLLDNFNSYIRDKFWQVEDAVITEDELNKLAYWMATGSGKTYIMHINILQSRRYFNLNKINNLLLIAPTEQVAEQNKKELEENGISVAGIDEGINHKTVRVTDIYKLTESDGDKSVDIREFGSRNIIFVDEAHKGLSSSNASGWVKRRDKLSKDGFAFEYSATFASSLSNNKQRYDEYSKSIIFDYPYGRFHIDRYGKDYNIVNIDSSDDLETSGDNEWLLANLLSYYEKLRIFQDEEVSSKYNMEKPLSVFIGNSVNAVGNSTDSITDQDVSDVQAILEFLDAVIQNDNNWVLSVLDEVTSRSNHFSSSGLFGDRFEHLHKFGESSEELYDDILRRIFDSKNPSELVVEHLKNLEDTEIGISTDETEDYIGVVTIGETSEFMNRLSDGQNQIKTVEHETYSKSLFDRIDTKNSPINILIGSKKFAEGWDSTRPSVMGLLKVGQNEGPLIVQMFGRGVRVNGEYNNGKRTDLDSVSDSERYLVKRLETLDIFGVKANYLEEFKSHLEEERITLDEDVVDISVQVDDKEAISTDLRVPKFKKDTKESQRPVTSLKSVLNGDSENISIEDIKTPSHTIQTRGTKVTHTDDGYSEENFGGDELYFHRFTDIGFRGDLEITEPLECLDWNRIWHSVLEYKQSKGYSEILIERESLIQIIQDEYYELNGPENLMRIDSIEELQNPRRIENICSKILSEFLDNVYSHMTELVTYDTVRLEPLDAEWIKNHTPDEYEVSVRDPEENSEVVETLTEREWEDDKSFEQFLLKQLGQLYSPVFLDTEALQNADLDGKYKESIKEITPEGIDNDGERRFIEALEQHINRGLLSEYEVVIMRNQSNSGISIPGANGQFYPDFVIWITVDGVQHIILADPHGMVFGEKSEFDLIRKVNEKETEENDVEIHACLFARTNNYNSFDDAKRNVAQNNNSTVSELRNNHTFFIDDTVSDVGETHSELERMLKRYMK